ncbi:MAG: hypothetical protein RBT43_07295 [bacterium]|jgi:hypothetical protein|nr:hypothetical protein [bacterium]
MGKETGLVKHTAGITRHAPMNVADVREQVNLIQHVMREVMKEGEHFGLIPGCGKKPALYKPGAEKLSLVFRLAPKFEITKEDLGNGHRNYDVRCLLYHITTGELIAEGHGSCSTMETKYRYRTAERSCPKCGKESIIKGKEEYGGGWICFKNKGGCGAKFSDTAPEIIGQNVGRVEYDNPADYWNTCLKMGAKRAHVAATLIGTAASDIFTQDIEENPDLYRRSSGGDGYENQEAEYEELPPERPTWQSPPARTDPAQPAPAAPPLADDKAVLGARRKEIDMWLLEMAVDSTGALSEAMYKKLLKEVSYIKADPAKNRTEHWADNIEDVKGKTWTNITHHAAKELYAAWQRTQAGPAQNTPADDDMFGDMGGE